MIQGYRKDVLSAGLSLVIIDLLDWNYSNNLYILNFLVILDDH